MPMVDHCHRRGLYQTFHNANHCRRCRFNAQYRAKQEKKHGCPRTFNRKAIAAYGVAAYAEAAPEIKKALGEVLQTFRRERARTD
jgi:hypothetical protein